ncbi:hypothetical protein L6R29_02875 [Myxococcota bacterium]|nr:hypothetical protein [Myxococcota bacterium]
MPKSLSAILKPLSTILLGLAAFFLASPFTQATIIVKLDDQQMAQRAHTIIQGRVLSVNARWHAKDRRIYTYIKIAVIQRFKGDPQQQEIDIRQVGGAIHSIGSHVPGSARFKAGEETLVFLERQHNPRYFHVMGMAYGKLAILEDPKTQKRFLLRDTRNIAAGSWNTKGRFQLQHLHHHKPIELDAFVQKLQSFLQPSPPKQQTTPPTLQPSPPKQQTAPPKQP